MGKKTSLNEFIQKARAVHGDRYDYSQVAYKNNSTKVEIICKEHGSFSAKPLNHIQNRSGCPSCAGCKRTTIDDFIARARAFHGDRFDYSKVDYKGVDTLVEIICPDHGSFWQIAYDHTQGHGCKLCGIEKCAAAHRRPLDEFIVRARTCAGIYPITLEEFIARARAAHGDRYDYSRVVFSRYGDSVEIVCKDHGPFWQVAKSHAAGHQCPDCAGVGRITETKLIARGQSTHGDRYDYSRVKIVNGATPVEIICPNHGIFLQRPIEHGLGAGCPECAGKAPITKEKFIDRAIKTHGNKYGYESVVFSKYKENVEIICQVHGPFWQTPYNHVRGSECPACIREQTTSKGENDLAQWIGSLGFMVIRNDRTVLGSMEIDIFLPNLKIGIEYNGAYWHSDTKLQHPRFHEVKISKARDAGIRLITVWDFDWEYRQEFIKKFLLHAFGLNASRKLNARSCMVRAIDSSVASDFYNQTHIQGSAWRTFVDYGLFYDGDLVACMSFSQGVSRRGKMGNSEWELIRFSTDGVVRGGAGKLLSAFVNDYHPQTIWSFSDRQHFIGGLYLALGFKEDGKLTADYRVFHESSGRIWHKSAWQRKYIPTRLTELGVDDQFDPATDPRTEREMQKIARVLRIMDAGKIRWKWENIQINSG